MIKTRIKRKLEDLYRTFDMEFLSPDPLEFVHRYTDPLECEVVGLIASSLAYGRVSQIRRSIENLINIMDNEPLAFTRAFSPQRDAKLLRGFKHRFNDSRDLTALITIAGLMIKRDGSIGGFFEKGYDKDAPTIKDALISFSARALDFDEIPPIYARKRLPPRAGVRYFFPSPLKKSACKRLNLYLRWMIRSGDALDFGLWKFADPAKLIIPLDTHIARISGNIGLSARKSADWKMAEEITAALRALDPCDPVKYDFALARLGILDRCPRKRRQDKCEACAIKEICIL